MVETQWLEQRKNRFLLCGGIAGLLFLISLVAMVASTKMGFVNGAINALVATIVIYSLKYFIISIGSLPTKLMRRVYMGAIGFAVVLDAWVIAQTLWGQDSFGLGSLALTVYSVYVWVPATAAYIIVQAILNWRSRRVGMV